MIGVDEHRARHHRERRAAAARRQQPEREVRGLVEHSDDRAAGPQRQPHRIGRERKKS